MTCWWPCLHYWLHRATIFAEAIVTRDAGEVADQLHHNGTPWERQDGQALSPAVRHSACDLRQSWNSGNAYAASVWRDWNLSCSQRDDYEDEARHCQQRRCVARRSTMSTAVCDAPSSTSILVCTVFPINYDGVQMFSVWYDDYTCAAAYCGFFLNV